LHVVIQYEINGFEALLKLLMLWLFERKIFFRKYFLYFLVLGVTENDSQ
jgi:hypothetical protein